MIALLGMLVVFVLLWFQTRTVGKWAGGCAEELKALKSGEPIRAIILRLLTDHRTAHECAVSDEARAIVQRHQTKWERGLSPVAWLTCSMLVGLGVVFVVTFLGDVLISELKTR